MVRHGGLVGFLTTLAVVAAFAAIAAADASATNLCSEAPNAANECPAGEAYGVGQVIEAQAGAKKLELKSAVLGILTCENSELKMKVTELGVGRAAVLETQKLEFIGCVRGGVGCVVEGKPIPGITQFSRTAAGNGEFFFDAPAGGGSFIVQVSCGAMICKYEAAALEGKFTGGHAAEIAFANAPLKAAACGVGKLTAKYLATNPKPIWATN